MHNSYDDKILMFHVKRASKFLKTSTGYGEKSAFKLKNLRLDLYEKSNNNFPLCLNFE